MRISVFLVCHKHRFFQHMIRGKSDWHDFRLAFVR